MIAVYEDHCDVSISNLSDYDGPAVLETTLFRFDGTVIRRSRRECRLEPDRNTAAERLELNKLERFVPEECFLSSEVTVDGKKTENHRFFASPRERRIPDAEIVCSWSADSPCVCTLETDGFADTVSFPGCGKHALPDDNFFDLCPGEKKTVRFSAPLPRKPEIVWKNRNRPPLIVRNGKEDTGGLVWQLRFFNPSKRDVILKLRLDAQEVFSDPQFETILRPHEVKDITLPLVPRPFPEYPCVLRLNLHHNGGVLLDLLEIDAPNGFRNGTFQWKNPLRIPVPFPDFEVSIAGSDLTEYRCRVPRNTVAPGGTLRFAWRPPHGALPFTASIRSGGRMITSFWESSQPFTRRQLALLPCREFDGTLAALSAPAGIFPLPMRKEEGTLFHPAEGMTGRLFLHFHAAELHLILFLENVPQEQHFEQEAVYRESCIELVLSDRERKHFRDYSLAKTPYGDQLFLRRGTPVFFKGLRNHLDGKLTIRLLPEGTVFYSLMLDTVHAGLEQLLKEEMFYLRLSVNWPGHRFQLTSRENDPRNIPVHIAADRCGI